MRIRCTTTLKKASSDFSYKTFIFLIAFSFLASHFVVFYPVAASRGAWIPFLKGLVVIMLIIGILVLDYLLLWRRGLAPSLLCWILEYAVFGILAIFLYPISLLELTGGDWTGVIDQHARDFIFLMILSPVTYLIFGKYGDKLREPGEVREPWKEKRGGGSEEEG